jgi:hypothetical protein
MDEKARWFTIPAAAFDDLLRHPLRCGMASDLDMQNLTVGMTDRKGDIEGLEPDRTHAEEITGPDILGMPLEKFSQRGDGFPPEGRRILRYGADRDLDRDSKRGPRGLGALV